MDVCISQDHGLSLELSPLASEHHLALRVDVSLEDMTVLVFFLGRFAREEKEESEKTGEGNREQIDEDSGKMDMNLLNVGLYITGIKGNVLFAIASLVYQR